MAVKVLRPLMPSAKVLKRFELNLGRVTDLLGVDQHIDTKYRDVLRAAVVLLHATLEDVLRELLRHELPNADPQVLKQFKLTLDDLHGLRQRKVSDVFRMVIGRTLDRRTFNGNDDLCGTLNQLGLKSSDYRNEIANVLPMIARRHKIVHQGDRGPGEDIYDHGKTVAISDSDVMTWANAVDTFVRKVIHEMRIKGKAPASKP